MVGVRYRVSCAVFDSVEFLDRQIFRRESLNDVFERNTFYFLVCGRRLFPTARIVGGEKASFGKWPWQVGSKFISNFSNSVL